MLSTTAEKNVGVKCNPCGATVGTTVSATVGRTEGNAAVGASTGGCSSKGIHRRNSRVQQSAPQSSIDKQAQQAARSSQAQQTSAADRCVRRCASGQGEPTEGCHQQQH